MTDKDKTISTLLLLREQPPVKSEVLEKRLNIPGGLIRDAVRELRRRGVPITSGANGYSFAKNIEELQPTLAHLKSRAMSELITIMKLERNFVNPSSQDNLFYESVVIKIINEVEKLYKMEVV